MKTPNISTKTKNTWCPGCWNFQILAGFKKYVEGEIKKGAKHKDFAIVSGIGCHGKIFDYVNLNGLNTLHGRTLPTCLGLKVGNPNLRVYGFSGDGDAFSEGISHVVHAARYNSDITYMVHNNQVFALTVGQPTSLTEKGFVDKTTPGGVVHNALNPIKLMLSMGAGFVARVYADAKQIEWVLKKASHHKGFKFIEIIQPCLIFHKDENYQKHTYQLHKKGHKSNDFNAAMKKAEEFNYQTIEKGTKIPLGIFYQSKSKSLEEKYPVLEKFMKNGKSWKNIRR
jgi:2-oxoglutarate/2-oxoacid ferredoxin oxidoreductase subunit beta